MAGNAEGDQVELPPNKDSGAAPSSPNGSAPPGNGLRHLFSDLQDEAADLVAQLRRHLRILIIFSAALFAGGMLYAWSGLYSVAASSGHYPFFRMFLAWAMRNSVETQTANYQVPELDDLAMVQRGAGHFQGGCSSCHGSPALQRNPIVTRMLPEPPYLSEPIRTWRPEQLFWIVKHGIKYAGMPSWVALERDDEVWSVVAFLLRLPDMDAATYRRLALGPLADEVDPKDDGLRRLIARGPVGAGIATCARCHGFDGLGRGTGAFPRLPGQTSDYLYRALKSYALGTRPSGIMQPVAAALSDAEMRDLADYYAQAPNAAPAPAAAGADPNMLQLGRRIAEEGLPAQNVAACASCHGGGRPPLYPSLDGQHANYIATQLRLWTQGKRGPEPLAAIMGNAVATTVQGKVTRTLSAEQIGAVSLYYASLPLPMSASGPATGKDAK